MLARSPGPGPAAEMLERRREPRLSWNCTAPPSETIQHPPRSRIGGYGSVLRPGPMILRRKLKNLAYRLAGESGGIQAPGACGPGLQGAWGPGPQGLGPGPPGAWAFSPQKPKPLKLRFDRKPPAGAWRRRGCRLKRLLRRWGPGGKRSRDTPPTPPPPPNPAPRFGAVREKYRRV